VRVTPNDVLAFVLELGALVALGYWGFRTGDGALAKVVRGLGAPLLAALLWGLFAAPRARFAVPVVAQVAVKVLVFGAATAALFATDHPVLASVLAALVVVNTAIVTVERGRRPQPGS